MLAAGMRSWDMLCTMVSDMGCACWHSCLPQLGMTTLCTALHFTTWTSYSNLRPTAVPQARPRLLLVYPTGCG